MSSARAPVGPNERIAITSLETFVLKSSWVFVKISTDAGIGVQESSILNCDVSGDDGLLHDALHHGRHEGRQRMDQCGRRIEGGNDH